MILRRLTPVAPILLAAFVLTGFFEPPALILNTLAKKLSAWNGLAVNGVRARYESGAAQRQEFHLKLGRPAQARLTVAEAHGEEGARAPEKLSEPVRRLLDIFLLGGDKARLYARLKEWGVGAETAGLARLDRTVCIALGALEGDLEKPQFWVEKAGGFPARLIFSAEEEGQSRRYDVRLTGWEAPAAQGLFPERVAIYRDGKLWESWTLASVEKTGS